MKVRVIAVGRRQPEWVNRGVLEYGKRLPRHLGFSLEEVAPVERRGTPVDRLRAQEAEAIRGRLQPREHVVALDEHGDMLTTMDMAASLRDWQAEGRDVSVLIGGADGLDPALLAQADQRWALGRLTLPHGLVRVIIVEALYRAWSVTQNHPYHRA